MEDLLTEYRVAGLALGICTFLIIGLFHPIVIKAEYYWGTRCWWVFLLLGLGGVAASVCVSDLFVSSLLGVFAFSSFWTIKEVFDQEKRVRKGWFPKNPRRKYKFRRKIPFSSCISHEKALLLSPLSRQRIHRTCSSVG